MDMAQLLQAFLSMQNAGGGMPDLGALFGQNARAQQSGSEPEPPPDYSGWAPDPDRAGASEASESQSEQTQAAGPDLAQLLPLFLQMMNADREKGSGEGDGSPQGDLAKLLPLFLQMMGGQNAGGPENSGNDLTKLLPLFLQMMNANKGDDSGREERTDPADGWAESDVPPRDVRRPQPPPQGKSTTRPEFEGESGPDTAPAWTEEAPRRRAVQRSDADPAPDREEQPHSDEQAKGLLPIAFAPPAMVHRLNLYFAHTDKD